MMCEEVSELMQRHLDGDLDPSEESVLQAHIAMCPECARLWDRLLRLHAELDALPKVKPPFSLVDAILPRLAEIDRAALEAAAPSADSVGAVMNDMPEKEAARRPRRRRKPWAAFGGVVAAGIVLGIYMINSDLMQTRMADDSRLLQSDVQNSASIAGEPARTMSTESGAMPAAPGSSSGDVNAKQNGDVGEEPFRSMMNPETEALRSGGGNHSPEAFAPQESSAGDGLQDAVPGRLSEPRMGNGKNEFSDSGGSLESMQGFQPPASAQEAAPPEDAHIPKAPAGERGEDVDKSDPPMGIASFPAEVTELPSPQGTYTASIEAGRIVIREGSGAEAAYTSPREWPPETGLSLDRWDGETRLYYRVTENGSESVMVIDLTAQTEMKAE